MTGRPGQQDCWCNARGVCIAIALVVFLLLQSVQSDDCDETFVNSTGTLYHSADLGRNCTWTFVRNDVYSTRFSFQLYNSSTLYTYTCPEDYIKISEGGDQAGEYGTYCPYSYGYERTVTGSRSNTLVVSFLSLSNHSDTNFAIYASWTSVCEKTFREGEVMHSPGYPHSYPAQQTCEFTCSVINVGLYDGYPLLNFTDFNLPNHTAQSCDTDYISVYDQGYLDTQRLCTANTPEPPVLRDAFRITFKSSDQGEAGHGFQAICTKSPPCGKEILTEQRANFTSPWYPSNYPTRTNCTWEITVEGYNWIQLVFDNFTLEGPQGCPYDWVSIFDGTTWTERYCGETAPELLQSSTNTITVNFVSDYIITFNGFSASYIAHNTTVFTNCGGNLTGIGGHIVSPNYPDHYPNNSRCEWTITAHPEDRIRVTLSHLDLENLNACQRDSLEFRDGATRAATRLDRVCGEPLPADVTSTGNIMYVSFVTDTENSGSGFNITWKTLCEQTYRLSSDTIQTTAATNSGRECTFIIEQWQAYVIRLEFEAFHLGNDSNDCQNNYVEVRNGGFHGSPLLGQRYCGTTSPPLLTSSQNMMWIRYVTDGSDPEAGFRATYRREEPRCDPVVIKDQKGTITSPLFPNNYPNGMNCTWEIAAETGHVIQLTFDTFTLEGHNRCPYDWLEILDGSTLLGKYCGVSGPGPVTSSSNRVTIRFRTDGIVTFQGFSASYVTYDPFSDELSKQLDLYPYGEENGDEKLVRRHDKAKKVRLDTGFPVGNQLQYKLFIANKGLVSFGIRERGKQLRLKSHKPMICPYNSDIGAENSDGGVYYQLYTDNRDILDKASSEIREFTEHRQYSASLVMIVTWNHVAHINSLNVTREQATFQLALISDGRRSYGIVFYKTGDMKWSVLDNQPLVIGISDGQQNEPAYSVYSNTAEAFTAMDRIKGNTGRYGMWLYTIGDSYSADQHCQDWYTRNLALTEERISAFSRLPQCPCNRRFIWGNWRWSHWRDNYNVLCFRMTVGRSRQFAPHGKECCYNWRWWGWWSSSSQFGQYITDGPHAGSATAFNQAFWSLRHDYQREDREAHDVCCYNTTSDRYCNMYYELRPVGECSTKIPFSFSWTWGDPHIKTLDGKGYTFNGWGEYTMITLTSEDLTFTLQGRTGLAETESGSITNATVFTGFGAEENGVRVFVGLDPNTNDTLIIYGNNSDYSTVFRDAGADDVFVESELYMMQRSNESFVVTFSSEIQLTVSIGYKSLDISTSIPLEFQNLTKGLLGNFNGIDSDDFLLPNGTVLSSDITERQIYEDFGPTWAVTESNTVMRYGLREGPADFAHPEFRPIYLDEVSTETRKAAEDLCGAGNVACIYDYVATGSQAIASASKNTNNTAEEREIIAKNSVPVIAFNKTINGTSGDTLNFNLQGHDPDTDDVLTYYSVDNGNGTVQVNSHTGDVTLSVNSANPVSLSFYAVDSKNVSSPVRDITIVTCSGCSNHGLCDYTRTTTSAVNGFQIAACDCLPAWTGENCDENFDACEESPCDMRQVCTDRTPQEQGQSGVGFTCTGCPDGFDTDSSDPTRCIDVDECAGQSNCTSLCTNTPGSYACSCQNGYRLSKDDVSCDDINECAEKTHDCEQQCLNTEGSFQCQCFPGYTLAAKGSCEADSATQFLCNNAGCEQGCTNVIDDQGGIVAQCFCSNGYILDTANNKTCVDRDECAENVCSQSCINNNGSFTCTCYAGHMMGSDQRTCSPCPQLRYGPECRHTCLCSGRGLSCHPVTGCVCQAGWTGSQCQDDVDECEENPDVCGEGKLCVNNNGSYICLCSEGYSESSDGVCQDINECSEGSMLNACQELADCTNVPGSYYCTCKNGYTRVDGKCTDIDECNSTQNQCGQVCTNVPGSYNCECRYGFRLNVDRSTCSQVADVCAEFEGLTCDHGCSLDDSDRAFCFCRTGYVLEADNQSCQDENECSLGTSGCSDNSDCVNTAGGYRCKCPTGSMLDNDGHSCLPCPTGTYGEKCNNTCACGLGSTHCDVMTGCVCKSGWEGLRCDQDINECITMQAPCQAQNTFCVNFPGGYRCSCSSGFTNVSGVCQDVNECDSSPCEQRCENSVGSYRCLCNAGFSFNATSSKCDDINECAIPVTNQCTQSCDNIRGSYRCSCDIAGYSLDNDGVTCARTSAHCNRTDCPSENGGCSEERCFCNNGYQIMSNNTCEWIDLDLCANNACDQECTESADGRSFLCSCRDGFLLNDDQRTCRECSEGTYGENCSNNCTCNTQHVAFCDHVNGTCSCKTGWEGLTCDDDIDECNTSRVTCPDHSECVNTAGSYECQCLTGFVKRSSGLCAECEQNMYGSDCAHQCNCTANAESCNHVDGACLCKTGWRGSSCESDVNECKMNQNSCLGDHEICVNHDGGFSCDCEVGYRKNESNSCVECEQNMYGSDCAHQCNCTANAESCNHVDGACLCKTGWRGSSCESDVNECMMNQNSCLGDHEICVNHDGGFSCDCEVGYRKNDYNSCVECPEGTYGKKCSNNCTCNITNVASCDHVNGTCSCKPGWKGVTCDDDIEECVMSQVTCPDHSECMNTVGSYECQCLTGFVKNSTGLCAECPEGTYGTNCSSYCACNSTNVASCDHVNGTCSCKAGWEHVTCDDDIDECNSSLVTCPAQSECVNTAGSYACLCLTGFVKNSTGLCAECDKDTYGTSCSEQCNCTLNAESCSHVDGACVCKTGWNGSRCENDVNECLTNQSSCPGDHMICVNEFGGFNCTCEEGYTKNGSNSCIDVDECLNERDNGCKQECSNTIGSYLCSCSPGFVGSGNDCRELTRIGMTVEMQITAPKAISDNTSETYKEWKYMAKNALYKKLKPQVPGLQAVIIKSLRLGSLVIDYDAAIDNETHPDAATDLTVAVMDLAKGQLTIDNQTANVSLTMNEMKVDTTTLACDVFKTVTPCPAKQECQIKDGAPGCQALTPDSGDQRPLYIAGVVGGLFVLATVLVVIVTLSLRRRRAATKKASAKDNGRDTVPAERTFTSISGKLQRSSSDRAASVASGSSLPSSRRMWRPYSP